MKRSVFRIIALVLTIIVIGSLFGMIQSQIFTHIPMRNSFGDLARAASNVNDRLYFATKVLEVQQTMNTAINAHIAIVVTALFIAIVAWLWSRD